jgi:hypothetical protein
VDRTDLLDQVSGDELIHYKISSEDRPLFHEY